MKVEVKFTANVVENEINSPWYTTVETTEPPFRVTLPSEWVTPLPIEEPTEPGFYKLTFDNGYVTVGQRISKYWYSCSEPGTLTWKTLLGSEEVEDLKLTAVERIA